MCINTPGAVRGAAPSAPCSCAQVCNDAVAIFFMFDLSRKSTLNSIKEWYRQVKREGEFG